MCSRRETLYVLLSIDAKNGHSFNDIAISITKICDSAIFKPPSFIFAECLETGVYPTSLKRAPVPVHTKNSTQSKNNHCRISLLPVFGRIFETLYLMLFIIIYVIIALQLKTNLVSALVTHFLTDCCQQRMQFILPSKTYLAGILELSLFLS